MTHMARLGTVTVLHTRIVTGAGGGPEKTIVNSPRHLAHTRYRELVCYMHPPGDEGFGIIRERARERDCPLFEVEERLPISPLALSRLARICREEKVAVWHGHDYKSNLYGVLLQPLLGFKLVTTLHGWVGHTWKTPLYYAIDRWTLPRHDHVVAVSEDLYREGLAAGVPADRLHLIENAIDTEEFRRRGPAALASGRDLPPGRLLIGAAGRLAEEKGFHLLIPAVAALIDRGHDIALWIAGEGGERERLETLIRETGHGDRIRLLGYRKDTRALFEAFDVFCLSSLREGLPNVMLEAMAMEVPVVATRCGGIGAMARDGTDMDLVEPGSPEALAAALERLIMDPDRRAALASAARRRIEADFSFRRRMDRFAEVYDLMF